MEKNEKNAKIITSFDNLKEPMVRANKTGIKIIDLYL